MGDNAWADRGYWNICDGRPTSRSDAKAGGNVALQFSESDTMHMGQC